MPTTFFEGVQYPQELDGESFDELPPDISRLYDEARRALQAGAPTAAALVLRTILMYMAVEKCNVKEGEYFTVCVDALLAEGWIPKAAGKGWIDTVRKIGNRACHRKDEISVEEASKAIQLVSIAFISMYRLPTLTAEPEPKPKPEPKA